VNTTIRIENALGTITIVEPINTTINIVEATPNSTKINFVSSKPTSAPIIESHHHESPAKSADRPPSGPPPKLPSNIPKKNESAPTIMKKPEPPKPVKAEPPKPSPNSSSAKIEPVKPSTSSSKMEPAKPILSNSAKVEPAKPITNSKVEPVKPNKKSKTGGVYFSYTELKTNKDLPIDTTRKENYLSDEEFLKVFKMSRAKFNEQKKWKQEDLKKSAQIF